MAALLSQSLIYKKPKENRGCCCAGWGWRERSPNPGVLRFPVTACICFLLSCLSPLNLKHCPSEGSGRENSEDCVSILSCVFLKPAFLSQMRGEDPSACELKDAFPVGPEFVW